MKYFADFLIKPYIAASNYRDICEIGASYGEHTDKLLEVPNLVIDVIDPCLDEDLQNKYRSRDNVHLHKQLSLDALSELGRNGKKFDCILLDGDHNWYTVFNELSLIHQHELLRAGGTIFLHDVGWPYARRDMYYVPESIPSEFLHPHEKQGITKQSDVSGDTVLANTHLYNALHEGGPRNGVLTGIEDFLKLHAGEYKFFTLQEEHGLGVMLKCGDAQQDEIFQRFENFARQREQRIERARRLRHIARNIAPVPYRILKRLWLKR